LVSGQFSIARFERPTSLQTGIKRRFFGAQWHGPPAANQEATVLKDGGWKGAGDRR
jgi:hypothetical protein